jgi:hypothetical protein
MVSSRPLVSSMLGISSPSVTVVSAAQEVQMVPPAFAGFRCSTWSKSELEDAVDLLGGMSDGKRTKPELFEQLYKLRSDHNLTRQEELKLKARRYKEMKRKAKSATRKAKIRRQRRAIKNELEYLSTPSSMECEICFEHITLELFISGNVSSSCSHDSTTSICRPCLQQSITIQSASAGWDRVGWLIAAQFYNTATFNTMPAQRHFNAMTNSCSIRRSIPRAHIEHVPILGAKAAACAI